MSVDYHQDDDRPDQVERADGGMVGAGEITLPAGARVALPGPERAWAGAAGALRRVWPTLGAFLGLRVLNVCGYAAFTLLLGRYRAGGSGGGRTLLTPEDSGWYRLIAERGYDRALSVEFHGSVFGFFPLYPWTLRFGHDLTRLKLDLVGLAVTWLAALAAAWALYEIGRLLHGPAVGTLLACLWAVAPAAVTESVMYADTLAIALSAWALYAVLRERWLTAGVLALLAGTARPTSAVVCLVVCAAALIALVRRRAGWRAAAAAVLAPAGALAYLGYVATRDHAALAYISEQHAGWGNHPDFGRSTLRHLVAGLHFSGAYSSGTAIVSTLVLLAVPVLLVIQLRRRQPWPLVAYCWLLVALVYGDDHFYTTSPRELLGAFPLLLPVALMLGRARVTAWRPAERLAGRVSRRSVLIGLFLVLGVASGWYADYLAVMSGQVT